MASSSGTSQEQRRWLVVGIALHHVLTPCLRDKIKTEMTPFYQHVVRNFGLDKQTYPAFNKSIPPSTVNLNYESINNNATLHRHPRRYDYCVKDEVSLAKLFMKPFMAQFNAFDSSFDSSAALSVLCGALPFTSVKRFAEEVRSKVRNEWAHCDFTAWTEAHYDTCFDLMEALVKNLRFTAPDEARILDELKMWKTQGLEICLGKTVDDTLLQVIRKEVQRLSDLVDDFKDRRGEDVKSICSTLALFKAEFNRAIHSLEEQQLCLRTTCEDLKNNQDMIKEEITAKDKKQREHLRASELHWEMRQEQVDSLCKTLDVKSELMQRDLEALKAKMDSLSFSDDSKEVVFDAPEQNKWFTGREEAMLKIERCLPFKREGALTMAAICGLGGCGKTTLGAQFAWKHKLEYEGGVFWISMEDDKKFENSLSDLALRLGMLADSFHLTLSKVLTWISKRKKPWLLVLDDVDQLHLSEQMHKVLSGRWKREAGGHVLLTTRREPKEVCESMDLESTRCVEVFAFSEDEAKRFLVTRCGATVTGIEVELNELVRELGCLPLALEQAGAHIKALQCTVSSYLEEYKIQRLKLLSQHPRTKPSWEYESELRLAVHTTWLLNFDYVRKSSHGEVASHFVQAAAFLAPNEIQEELINPQLLSDDQPSSQSCHFPFIKNQIVEIVTKFSLFQRKSSKSLGLHRLVQEVIRNKMTVEESASALLRAVRILHQSLCDCPSPDQILVDITTRPPEQPSTAVANPSLFYLWLKLTGHASDLQQHLKTLLDRHEIGRDVKTVVVTHETSRVVYENAVQLSVHGHQEEAKEAERFAFQILDSCTGDSVAVTLEELKKLFPHSLPLPQLFQKIILYSSRPPTDAQDVAENDDHLIDDIDEIRLRGNAFFKNGRFKEAVQTYTEALEASKRAKQLDPRLLHNRATANLKLRKCKECLQDSEEYINLRPNCWKGYTRKALALNGLGKKGFSLCSAAIAYYYDAESCRRYEGFQSVFKNLDGKWAVVESSEALQRCIIENKSPRSRKNVLLLTNGHYEIKDAPLTQVGEVTFVLNNFDGSNDILDTTLAAFSDGSDAVTITCGGSRFSKECFLQNISLLTNDTIFVAPDGDVEFTNCRFTSTHISHPAIIVYGTAKLINCSVSDCPGGGITVEGLNSSASLKKCKVNGNGKEPRISSGIHVVDGGSLEVSECQIHGNTEGINVSGTNFNNSIAKEALIQYSEIYDNKFEGIHVSGHPSLSSFVIIRRNKIYHNGGFGMEVAFHVNNIHFEDNMVFENFWWGVWVQCNSGGHYKGNEICNNKMGGIRVGRQSPGKPASVVESNVIHDNCGPAFYEGLKYFEVFSFPSELEVYFEKHEEEKWKNVLKGQINAYEVFLPNAVSAVYKSDNQCNHNDTTRINMQAASSKTNCAFCFQCETKLKCCKRCMTAMYCGKECQKLHWGKHKYMCKAIGQMNTIEIQIPVYAPDKGVWRCRLTHPSLEPKGPRYASPPPRDGTRFVVKLQTFEGLILGKLYDGRGYVSDEYNPQKATISIYDRSLSVDFEIRNQPKLYHLIMECGMMGAYMYLAKKMFFWAAFKDGKTLRIFTHEFPPVQKW